MLLHKGEVFPLEEVEVVTVLKHDIVAGHKVEEEGTELAGVVLLRREEDAWRERRGGGGGGGSVQHTLVVIED